MHVQEYYHALPLAANSVTTVAGNAVAAFLAVTAGTISVAAPGASGANVLLPAFPVTAGQYLFLNIYTGVNGSIVTLAGGASGTLLHA